MNSDYQDLPFAVTQIDTHYIRPHFAAAYLIVEQGRGAFVETGPLPAAPRLMGALKRVGLKATDVDAIIVTHVHLDHAGGAGEMMRLCPSAKLYVHDKGARHLIDPAKLKASALEVYGEKLFQKTLGDIIPTPHERVVSPTDGEEISIGGRILRFIDTPGHARHHFCLWDPMSRGLFTGDAFGISYREFDGGSLPYIYPPTTPTQLDPENFHRSLDRLAALDPETLYLTHYGALAYRQEFLPTLHAQLDETINLARRAEKGGQVDHHQLLAHLKEHGLAILKAIQSPLADGTGDPLLLADREINAQGLEFYLQRLKQDKKS